jgi:hypothetical protein
MRTVFWFGNPEGNIPLGTPRRRWKDNIRTVLRDWIRLAQDRDQWRDLVDTVLKLFVSKKAVNFLTS